MADEELDKDVRRFIVAEVAAQLKPFKELLDAVHDWQISFWSNGSGRPPGFFQSRMREDDERNAKLKADLEKQTEISDRMDDFIKAEMTLREQRKKQIDFWLPIAKWVMGGVASAVLALIIWLGPKVGKASYILWQDYLKAHPEAAQQLKKVDAAPKPDVQLPKKDMAY